MKLYQLFVGMMAAIAAIIFPSVASAAVDTTAIVTEIKGNESGMTSVGMAMLGLVVIVVLFTMVRRVLK